MLAPISPWESNQMPLASDSSVRAFKCPSCGAPLEPETGTLTMKCPYCGGTVIIPESLRTPAPQSGPTIGQVFDFGLNGLDMNQIIGNAMHLPQAIQLAKQGQIDEAAKIYSQITGMQHDDAVKAVQSLANGHAVSLTPGQAGVRSGSGVTISPSAQAASASLNAPSAEFSSTSFSTTVSTSQPAAPAKKSGRGCGLLLAISVAVAVLIALLLGAMLLLFGGKLGGAFVPFGLAHLLFLG
jgi:predicted RNA-binding Zn-ribbon protein involved in translation (DUF1610 family)